MGLEKIFKNVIIKNLLLVILFFGILVSGISVWLNAYTNHGESVEIPNVKALKPEVAKPLFEARELSYQVIDSTYNKTISPGTIIETIPPAGSKVKKGRTVYVRLNSYSAGMISIPDVMDVSHRQATAMLKALGFEKIETRWVEGHFRDLVIGVEYKGQTLQIKEKVPANAVLTLLVSSGSSANQHLLDSLEEIPTQLNEDIIEDSDISFDF
ncbi:MAG: PASTA domain-containing protein [Dysgonamonadaceae bacterium]|jgi:beta-lactam-binding protein with PASTA domain|nr:PASTA domain-containing protein [Dysgonamonadaceae bacterium]